MCVDPTAPTEVVLRLMRVPGVRGEQVGPVDSLYGAPWSGPHHCALPVAKRAVAPEVRSERLVCVDLKNDAPAMARASVGGHDGDRVPREGGELDWPTRLSGGLRAA
jgi:hypothetical protein